MAVKELRWESLVVLGLAAAGDAQAEFRNDSDGNIFIRDLWCNHLAKTVTPGDEMVVELTKRIALTSRTNNQSQYAWAQSLAGGPTGATPNDGSVVVNAGRKYAKGQLMIEPGESLFVNYTLLTGACNIDISYILGYEFA